MGSQNLKEQDKPRWRTIPLGVWDLVLLSPSGLGLGHWKLPGRNQITDFLSVFPYVVRLYKDIYALAPRQIYVYIFFSVFQSFEGTVGLYYNSRLLEAVSEQLNSQNGSETKILHAIVARFVCSAVTIWMKKTCRRDLDILQDRVKLHFMTQALRANLNLDLLTAEDPEVKEMISPDKYVFQYGNEVYRAFDSLNDILTGLVTTLSQVILVFKLLPNNAGGLLFIIVCLVQPLMKVLDTDSFWTSTYVTYCANTFFREMASLRAFAYDEKHRIDRLSDNVADYVETEFKRNREMLGDVCTAPFYSQMGNRKSLGSRLLRDTLHNLPMFAFALKAMINPQSMTLSSLMIQQQTAQSTQWTFYRLSQNIQSIASTLIDIKKQYKLADVQNRIKNGSRPYPGSDLTNSEFAAGMCIEFRNVSFAYPGTTKAVLNEVSFTIKPGQLVVIVGVNGSGKSSMIKLFNRLFDPTEGEILVDGHPLSSYRIADVRRSTAMLRQDHKPYPVSIKQNVTLGRSDYEATEEDVQDALRLGGAHAFVEKLPKKLDDVLNPVTLSRVQFQGAPVEELKKMVEEKEKVTDIPGGESQRLAASRTFMRLSSGQIRFLAADEPTSALDPEGEFELFTRLRLQRKGKTIVFITHRFGHLTKHADLILCMKDGVLVERGTHEELIASGGEYFRLHNVQAQAFVTSSATG